MLRCTENLRKWGFDQVKQANQASLKKPLTLEKMSGYMFTRDIKGENWNFPFSLKLLLFKCCHLLSRTVGPQINLYS